MIKIENTIHKQIALIVDFIGKIFYHFGQFCGLWNIKKNNLEKIKPKKILIIEEEPMGDVIMATAIFPSLREKYPDAHIAVMVGSWARDILLNNPYINEIIIQDCPWAFSDLIIGRKGIIGHLKYFLSYPKFLEKLKKKDFDLGIDLRGDFRNILFFIFLPAIKYSLSFSRSGGDYLLTQSIYFEKSKHEVEKNFVLLKHLGVEEAERETRVFPSKKDYEKLGLKIKDCGVKNSESICVIHPGIRRKVRLWPLNRYAKVADFIYEKYRMKIILTGSENEKYLTNRIIQYMQHKDAVVNFSGRLSFLELAALLEKTRLLICPDTSVMHLASVFYTPTVALFGPGDPTITGPFQRNAIVVDKNFSCRPCLQKGCKLQNNGISACMEAITVEDVKRAVEKITQPR